MRGWILMPLIEINKEEQDLIELALINLASELGQDPNKDKQDIVDLRGAAHKLTQRFLIEYRSK